MPPKPTVGQSSWGPVLNAYLDASHNTDGTLKAAAIATAIPVGDAGDQIATSNGIDWLSIKPGRIDARVRGLSTAASDNVTLLTTLATESGSTGAELWIPEGVYRTGMVGLPANARISGPGTLQAPAVHPDPFIFNVGASSGVSVSMVTLDGLADVGGINGDGGSNLRIDRVAVKNTNDDAALSREGVRLFNCTNVDVESSAFDCALPLKVINSQRVRIHRNGFANSVGNPITVWAVDSAFVGQGVEVTFNHGIDVQRIGVEFYANDRSRYYASPLVMGNDFTILPNPVSPLGIMGYSLPGARNARIIDNAVRFLGTGTPPTYGIEVIGPGHAIKENYIYGFGEGVIFNSAPYASLVSNVIEMCVLGVTLTNSEGVDSRGLKSVGNQIINPRDYGYVLRETFGGIVSDNDTIRRDIAWTGDGTRSFNGFGLEAQSAPLQITRPLIVQGQAAPTAGFAFRGIAAFTSTLGQLADSRIEYAQFHDLKTGGSMMDPLFSNAGGGVVSDVVLTANSLTNASGVTSAVTSW